LSSPGFVAGLAGLRDAGGGAAGAPEASGEGDAAAGAAGGDGRAGMSFSIGGSVLSLGWSGAEAVCVFMAEAEPAAEIALTAGAALADADCGTELAPSRGAGLAEALAPSAVDDGDCTAADGVGAAVAIADSVGAAGWGGLDVAPESNNLSR
jgi:hypothetical protein